MGRNTKMKRNSTFGIGMERRGGIEMDNHSGQLNEMDMAKWTWNRH